jgi:hypothetical protein
VDDVRKDTQKLEVPNWKTEENGKSWLKRPKLCTKEPHKEPNCD